MGILQLLQEATAFEPQFMITQFLFVPFAGFIIINCFTDLSSEELQIKLE